MNWRLRAAVEDDLNALLQVARDEGVSAPSVSLLAAALATDSGHSIVLAEEFSLVLGWVWFSQVLDELTVLNILVAPTQRRRGIARGLMAEVLNLARGQGVSRCLLEVRVSNQAAQQLYQSLEFVVDGRRKNYYPQESGREDALLMSLSLHRDGEHPE